jgi:hypothetical protein
MKSILLASMLCTSLSLLSQEKNYISTDNALRSYGEKYQEQTFVLFPEVREKPVQWFDSLRVNWFQKDWSKNELELNAKPGEYYTYQLVVWAIDNLNNVQVKFSELKGNNGKSISIKEMTCFDTGGINFHGKPFVKQVIVQKGRAHSFWVGINLDKTTSGIYKGKVSVVSNGKARILSIILKVAGDKVADHGYSEGKRMSRLNWLNSTVGIEDVVTKPFTTLVRESNNIKLLGRQFTIGKNGLPSSILTYFTPSVQTIGENGEEILNKPMNFILEKNDGKIITFKSEKIKFIKETKTGITWVVNSASSEVELKCEGTLGFDGHVEYKLTVNSLMPIIVKDMRLEVPMAKEKAEYMMGLNTEGGFRPQGTYNWKWDTISNQDMLWIGAVNGGLRLKWKGENYVRPLVNIYYAYGPLNLPSSWGNHGSGGVKITEDGDDVMVNAYSGYRELKKGDVLHYDFELLITPFKPINKTVQFGDLYFHPVLGTSTKDIVQNAKENGANIITIHHGCDVYPFINYPFADEFISDLKRLINDAHKNHMRMKFYYTTRELTKNIPEFWAFRSLDSEIIFPGVGNDYISTYNGSGAPAWCKDNLKEKYIPAWCQVINEGIFKGLTDISVITTPDSRLNNFYLSGLDWMVRNMELDGIYIDDAASDRMTLCRARRIIDRYRPNGRIDLHSWNVFNKAGGYANCLNVYMDLLPYIDLTWIGEGRDYSRMPDHWLIEQSGIPYGLPGQMIGEGNPWKGMVFGESNRLGWGGNPCPLWKFWDQYDIIGKEMIGFWDKKNNPLSVNNDLVKATLYKGNKESIISVAAWGSTDQVCNIKVDWNKLGYDEKEYIFYLPEIQDFQQAQIFPSLQSMKISQNKGFLIVITPKRF